MSESAQRASSQKGAPRPLIALAGNPNTGKSTLFNGLTGLNTRVGNYPGITVDRLTGLVKVGEISADLLDVPGCYSLNARSREEEIAIGAILGMESSPPPDVVVAVVDATLLERNLYLVFQLLELGLKPIIALNMMDAAHQGGLTINIPALEAALGLKVVPISASKEEGFEDLKAAMAEALAPPEEAPSPENPWPWEPPEALAAAIEEALPRLPLAQREDTSPSKARGLALWALMSADAEDDLLFLSEPVKVDLMAIRERWSQKGVDLDEQAVSGRYARIDALLVGVFERPAPKITWTDRLDSIFTHPILGFGIFVTLMFLIFSSLFAWADPAIAFIEDTFAALGGLTRSLLGEGLLSDFLVDGVIGGVGSVLVFLPQILLLFLFIAILESSGYMARASFLMDRVMRSVGLHGRAFVPMLSGYACAIPAIMATRTMERERDRLLTMMAIPLMSCSARLPVYTLLIAAIFPPDERIGPFPVAAFLLGAMYLFSTAMALIAAGIIGRTVLKGESVPLLLEMPPYRVPSIKGTLRLLYLRGKVFVSEAGGVILVCTIVLWGLLSFPKLPESLQAQIPGDSGGTAVVLQADPALSMGDRSGMDEDLLGEPEETAALAYSYGGRLGRFVEPVIAPLGFDWKIGVGIIGAFAAREVFVSTMGVIYGVGGDVDEESGTLREKLRQEVKADGTPRYTPLVGLSLMVFFALACQCMSTLAVIKRETKGWKWPAFVFAYMTVLAYLMSLLVYQGGLALGFT